MKVGREVTLAQRTADPRPKTQDPRPQVGAALEVRDLTVPSSRKTNAVDAISFSVAPGEILGIAGVEGNGQTELIEAIAGLRDATGGSITMAGMDITRRSVRDRG